jgi:hypothetical protein
MAPVFERLRELEIYPLDGADFDRNVDEEGILVSRVRVRAAEIEADLRERTTYSSAARRRRGSGFRGTVSDASRKADRPRPSQAEDPLQARATMVGGGQLMLPSAAEQEAAGIETALESATVADVLLESDLLQLTRVILPSGSTIERERLLYRISAELKQPLSRKLRSALNRMLSREVRAGRLEVDDAWVNVRRPEQGHA